MTKLADALDGVLCIDEAYVYSPNEPASTWPRRDPNVQVMPRCRRANSLAGLRFGYCHRRRGPPDRRLMKVKDSYNADAIAIAAATAAIADRSTTTATDEG